MLELRLQGCGFREIWLLFLAVQLTIKSQSLIQISLLFKAGRWKVQHANDLLLDCIIFIVAENVKMEQKG